MIPNNNSLVSPGDVFYNTHTDEYCWIIALEPVLGAMMQYEDGTLWDDQIGSDGVPTGPYEDRELPDDYEKPVPDIDNSCDPGEHDFGLSEPPTSYHDVEGLCRECGLSTGVLMELYGQCPLKAMEFQCIGCGTTNSGKELINDGPTDETAICEDCWDPNKSLEENLGQYE